MINKPGKQKNRGQKWWP